MPSMEETMSAANATPLMLNYNNIDYRVCQAAMDDKAEFDRLALWGREEIKIAESEMPGLMGLRKEYGAIKPLR